MKASISFFAIIFAIGCASFEDEQKFIKDYKLLKLDGESCSNCVVRVKQGHTYDILKDGVKVGDGYWSLKKPIDLPDCDLRLENGPRSMIYDSDTIIDFINRK